MSNQQKEEIVTPASTAIEMLQDILLKTDKFVQSDSQSIQGIEVCAINHVNFNADSRDKYTMMHYNILDGQMMMVSLTEAITWLFLASKYYYKFVNRPAELTGLEQYKTYVDSIWQGDLLSILNISKGLNPINT